MQSSHASTFPPSSAPSELDLRDSASLYKLLGGSSESDGASRDLNSMDVLLEVIEANPGHPPTSQNGIPSLSAFFQDRNDPSSSAHASSTGAGMSISSLLAASQQLASPETTRNNAASNAARRQSWIPTSSALASFQDDGDMSFEGGQYALANLDRILEGSSAGNPRLLDSEEHPGDLGVHDHEPPQVVQVAQKRKWDETGIEERREKIQRSIKVNAIGMPSSQTAPSALTTVLCLHASVAQKSYGTEKRYLCPPPMVRIEGPMRQLEQKPRLTLSIVSDQGDTRGSEKARLSEPQMKAYFRGLHVSGTAKAKSFSLQLSLHPPTPSIADVTEVEHNPTGEEIFAPPFASFASSDVAIISKPSKKTAKARNTTSCIFAGSTISLFNRINSQTVRTKYMAIDDGHLAARTSQWTAFSIHVLRRSEDTVPGITETLATSKIPNGAMTVTYGSEILLTDLITGVSSERLVVRKVEKNKVLLDATGPVSQLQKLALMRVDQAGNPIYLSAATDGMDASGNEFVQSTMGTAAGNGGEKAAKRRRKEVDDDTDDITARPVLTYQSPKSIDISPEGLQSHEVDDYMSWTVIGITSFSYSFFDGFGNPQQPTLPTNVITPFPTVSSPPEYHSQTHSLSTTITNFYYTTPGTTEVSPLEVWLGPIGPLKLHDVEPAEIAAATPGATSGSALPVDSAGLEVQAATRPRANVPTALSIALPSFEDIVAAAGHSEAPAPTPTSTPASAPTFASTSAPTFADLIASPTPTADSQDIRNVSSSSVDLERSLAALADSMNVASGSGLPPLPNVDFFLSTSQPAQPGQSAPFATSSSRRIAPLPKTHQTQVPQPDLSTAPFTPRPASLPLIIVRPSDGTGYMTGRWVVAERAGQASAADGDEGRGVGAGSEEKDVAGSFAAIFQAKTPGKEDWAFAGSGAAAQPAAGAWQIRIV